MKFAYQLAIGLVAAAGVTLAVTTFEHPPVEMTQRGYRGVAEQQVTDPRIAARLAAQNVVPQPEDAQSPAGQLSSAAYSNVQVLKNVDANELLRLMAAITTWVAPKEGCTYCHTDDLAADTLYTKRVARRMLQMVEHVNLGWKSHVGSTGVTCYTCHRGNPVPQNIWFDPATHGQSNGLAQEPMGKDKASSDVGDSSLPSDVFEPFLNQVPTEIRVEATQALPGTDLQSIKQTEWTYGLMMHISQSLGVNCTYCHNTRQFADWSQSTPQRMTAWYGIRMVRDLNTAYLDPLASEFPHARLGPLGDGPKLNCATCHMGVSKPLYGVSMLKDYPVLDTNTETVAVAPTPTEAPAPAPNP